MPKRTKLDRRTRPTRTSAKVARKTPEMPWEKRVRLAAEGDRRMREYGQRIKRVLETDESIDDSPADKALRKYFKKWSIVQLSKMSQTQGQEAARQIGTVLIHTSGERIRLKPEIVQEIQSRYGRNVIPRRPVGGTETPTATEVEVVYVRAKDKLERDAEATRIIAMVRAAVAANPSILLLRDNIEFAIKSADSGISVQDTFAKACSILVEGPSKKPSAASGADKSAPSVAEDEERWARLGLPKAPARLWTPRPRGRPRKGISYDDELINFIREVYSPYLKDERRNHLRSYIFNRDWDLYDAIVSYERRGDKHRELPADIQMPSEPAIVDSYFEIAERRGAKHLNKPQRRAVAGRVSRRKKEAAPGA